MKANKQKQRKTMLKYARAVGKWLGQCCSGGDQCTDESSGPSSPDVIREQPVIGKELMGLRQDPIGEGPSAFADFVSMTRDTLPWEELLRQLDEDREIEEQRVRKERDAPDYGTVTMVRNGTRRVLEVYAEGESEPCLFVCIREQAALPRRCNVNAKLLIKSERLGQAVTLECVIDRLRNQDVNVTADVFDRMFVRVLDREESVGDEPQKD
jgi:hypothetical protein